MNWTAFISKRSWPIQGTTTALSGNNWRKTRKPLRIWRIRAGMWTGTSRTHVQSPTDAPITLRQNASCAKSYWLCKLAWPGSESGPLSDFFLRDYDPKKKKQKKLILVKKRCANLMGTTGSAKQPSCQSCYYSLMFSKYIVCLWFTQYTVPAQVTP